jgi:hypothetical protein
MLKLEARPLTELRCFDLVAYESSEPIESASTPSAKRLRLSLACMTAPRPCVHMFLETYFSRTARL